MTFKVGDRVVVARHAQILLGKTGTITEIKHGICLVNIHEVGMGGWWVGLDNLDHAPVEKTLKAAAPAPTPPPCSFCGQNNASAVHQSGLRCQAEPWHYCARVGCCESIDLHVSRLENGLVDCPETRAATRAWYLAKFEREKKEARLARLARMVP